MSRNTTITIIPINELRKLLISFLNRAYIRNKIWGAKIVKNVFTATLPQHHCPEYISIVSLLLLSKIQGKNHKILSKILPKTEILPEKLAVSTKIPPKNYRANNLHHTAGVRQTVCIAVVFGRTHGCVPTKKPSQRMVFIVWPVETRFIADVSTNHLPHHSAERTQRNKG